MVIIHHHHDPNYPLNIGHLQVMLPVGTGTGFSRVLGRCGAGGADEAWRGARRGYNPIMKKLDEAKHVETKLGR